LHINKERSQGDGDVGFCSACAKEMDMLRRNKKRRQGDEDVSFCSGLICGWMVWLLSFEMESGGRWFFRDVAQKR